MACRDPRLEKEYHLELKLVHLESLQLDRQELKCAFSQGEKGEEGQDGRDGSKGESGEKGFRGHPGLTGAEGTPVKKYPY